VNLESGTPAVQTSYRQARPGRIDVRWLLALLGLAAWLAAAQAAAAAPEATTAEAVTPEAKSAARDAATAGIRAFQNGDYDGALDLLRKAEDIVHAPPHLIYIARAHTAKGEFVLARETLMILINEVLPAEAPSAFRDAQAAGVALKNEIEPKIGRISIHVEGTSADPVDGAAFEGSFVVTVDGKVVPEAILDLPYPVDPGVRKLAVAGENAQGEEVSVTVLEGQSQDVTLHLVATPPPPVEAAVVAVTPLPPPPPPEPEARKATSPWVFIGFGTAAAGVLVGSITGGLSLAKTNDAKATYCTGTSCSPAGAAALDEANALANVSNVAFALAALGVGAGIYGLIATHKQSKSQPTARSAMPKGQLAISPQGVRANLAWRF
jgi:hypothetical protein